MVCSAWVSQLPLWRNLSPFWPLSDFLKNVSGNRYFAIFHLLYLDKWESVGNNTALSTRHAIALPWAHLSLSSGLSHLQIWEEQEALASHWCGFQSQPYYLVNCVPLNKYFTFMGLTVLLSSFLGLLWGRRKVIWKGTSPCLSPGRLPMNAKFPEKPQHWLW